MDPITFDSDEKRLLITMLAREGQESARRSVRSHELEFTAQCFDLAAKIARAEAPPAVQIPEGP